MPSDRKNFRKYADEFRNRAREVVDSAPIQAKVLGRAKTAPPESEPVPARKSKAVPIRAESPPQSGWAPESERVFIRSHYTRVLNVVIDKLAPTLPPSAALAYLHLYRLAYGHGNRGCRVSIGSLAERCNLGKTALREAVRHLEQRGLVRRIGVEFGGSNLKDRGAEWYVELPAETLPESVTASESGPVANSEHMKREDVKESRKAPVAVAPALDIYAIRKVAARFREARKGEPYSRDDLKRDVKTALGVDVEETLLEDAIG